MITSKDLKVCGLTITASDIGKNRIAISAYQLINILDIEFSYSNNFTLEIRMTANRAIKKAKRLKREFKKLATKNYDNGKMLYINGNFEDMQNMLLSLKYRSNKEKRLNKSK